MGALSYLGFTTKASVAGFEGWVRVTCDGVDVRFYKAKELINWVRVKKAPWYAPWNNLETYEATEWKLLQ